MNSLGFFANRREIARFGALHRLPFRAGSSFGTVMQGAYPSKALCPFVCQDSTPSPSAWSDPLGRIRSRPSGRTGRRVAEAAPSNKFVFPLRNVRANMASRGRQTLSGRGKQTCNAHLSFSQLRPRLGSRPVATRTLNAAFPARPSVRSVPSLPVEAPSQVQRSAARRASCATILHRNFAAKAKPKTHRRQVIGALRLDGLFCAHLTGASERANV